MCRQPKASCSESWTGTGILQKARAAAARRTLCTVFFFLFSSSSSVQATLMEAWSMSSVESIGGSMG